MQVEKTGKMPTEISLDKSKMNGMSKKMKKVLDYLCRM